MQGHLWPKARQRGAKALPQTNIWEDTMAALIWGGAVVTLLGVAGLMFCAAQSLKARTLPEDQARAAMARVVAWNLGSVGVAVLGLMAVVAGLLLR